MTNEEIKDLIPKLCHIAHNKANIEELTHLITHEHLTHQQQLCALALNLILKWAEQEDNKLGDARNEATRRISVKIRQLLRDEGFAFVHNGKEISPLPLI